MHPTFTDSPKGLLLTSAENVVHQPPAAPAVNIKMIAGFAPVAGVQIPSTLKIVMPNVLILQMNFVSCTLAHQFVLDAPQSPKPLSPETVAGTK
jgi:hypothetical protein